MNMKTITLTLWDLLAKPSASKESPKTRPIQEKYDALVIQMKETYGFRIRKWRNSMSGCAWELKDRNGTISRMLESPYPKGPMSCAIFLHEVGHHAIGFHVYKPRCLEEFHAWEWALSAMEANGIRITSNVLKRRDNAMEYALAKALRRGLKVIPKELLQFAPSQLDVCYE